MLTLDALALIAEQVGVRVLRWFARSGLIEPDDVREMLARETSGFSLDASVHVAAQDRAGLERLRHYCARPPFALERLELLDAARVVYRLPAPQRDGATALTLTPQASTSILVSASLMSRPLHGAQTERRDRGGLVRSPDISALDAVDFGGSLGLTLRAYLPEGHPTIQLAAEIVGTSVRKFQRQLALLGIRYSDLVQQVRFEVAAELQTANQHLMPPGIRLSGS